MPSLTSNDGVELKRTRSELARALLRIDGKPVNLDDYPMFLAIYDGGYKRTLLKTSRQVGKSTTLSNFSVAESIAEPHFKTFFISPSQEQTHKFSTERVGKTIMYSPLVKKHFIGDSNSNRVMVRSFKRGSTIYFSYAEDDADRCRGVTADRLCFAASTQVLTRKGWVEVSDLSYADEIADVNDAGQLEWNRPTALIFRNHTGEMVRFKHRGIDLRVTADHVMRANFRHKGGAAYKTPDRYEFVPASDLARTSGMGFKFTCAAEWPNKAIPEFITLPGVDGTYGRNRDELRVPQQAFAELMGWYISEGHLQWKYTPQGKRYPRMIITQNEGRYATEIQNCLLRCGLSFSVNRRHTVSAVNRVKSIRCTFTVNAPQVGAFAAPLGHARDKYIPACFFEHTDLLRELLRSLYLGDACYHSGDPWDRGVLRTRSRRLADDVTRAWLALGRPAATHTLMVPPRAGAPPEPMYDVAAHKQNYYVFWRSEFVTKKRVTAEPVVDEPVYCFTVKNHRPVVRGGFGQKPLITSQCLDEVQDINLEAVIPVVKETIANSEYAYEMYCGTPKTMENGIELMWKASTKSEWAMKCEGCGRYSVIVSEKQLGKHGPICTKCGKALNPRFGVWIDTNRDPGVRTKGFHISRAIMPKSVPICWSEGPLRDKAQEKWDEVLDKLEGPGAYPLSMFRNEVLGVSDSEGVRLLTKEDLEVMCDGPDISPVPTHQNMADVMKIAAGFDWSGGGTEVKSRTVLTVQGQLTSGRVRLLYFKIFPGTSPLEELNEITQVVKNYDGKFAMFMGGDAGEGNMNMDSLRNRFQKPQRILKIRYVGTQNTYVKWNSVGGFYTLHRTPAIDSIMTNLKMGKYQFPANKKVMEVAFNDILNEHVEVTTQGRKRWDHASNKPDDFLHALVFGRLALQVSTGELNLGSAL
jgi:hypothetical protein